MAAIHDVMDAVHWVSTGWPNVLHVPWSGQVFAAGASSGGNLVAMAATQTAPDATYHPRAVAMWSGVPEFDRVSNITDFPVEDDYVCNLTSENAGCWTHVNNYLGCYQGGVPPPTVENGCTDVPTGNGRYQKASPNYYYSQNPGTSSPVFFANGGGPRPGTTHPEHIGLNTSDELRTYLRNVDPTRWHQCINDAISPDGFGLHATAYLFDTDPTPGTTPDRCEDAGADETVLQTTDNFLGYWVTHTP